MDGARRLLRGPVRVGLVLHLRRGLVCDRRALRGAGLDLPAVSPQSCAVTLSPLGYAFDLVFLGSHFLLRTSGEAENC